MDVFDEARGEIRRHQKQIETLWAELQGMSAPESYEESGGQALARQHYLAEIRRHEQAIFYHRAHLPPYAELKDGFLVLHPARGERFPSAMDPV